MKVAYVAYIDPPHAGMVKKCEGILKAGRQAFDSFDLFILNHDKSGETDTGVIYSKLQVPMNKFLKIYKLLFFRLELIKDSVDFSAYDAVILRGLYAPAHGGIVTLQQRYPKVKFYFEVNGLSSAEVPFGFRLRQMLWWLMHKYNQPTFKRRISGMIAVTGQIECLERKGFPKLKTHLMPNGFDVLSVPQTGFTPFDNKTLKLAFVCSEFSPWHGLMRLINSIRSSSSVVKIELHLVGAFHKQEEKIAAESLSSLSHVDVFVHGLCSHDALTNLYSGCNMAIASLGFYTKGYQEGSSLKVREYMARGIPFILSIKDPDLHDVPSTFCHRVPNDASHIDFDKVVDFARQAAAEKQLSEKMRQYAMAHIDWSVKMKGVKNFIENNNAG